MGSLKVNETRSELPETKLGWKIFIFLAEFLIFF